MAETPRVSKLVFPWSRKRSSHGELIEVGLYYFCISYDIIIIVILYYIIIIIILFLIITRKNKNIY